ncbi:unnamed protein product, partial [Schistosoma turkestanicum]
MTTTLAQVKSMLEPKKKNIPPNFNVTIHGINDNDNLQTLLSYLFPEHETKDIVIKVLNKGHSNKLIKIEHSQHSLVLPKLSSLLIRIYGDLTTSLIDRTNEMKYMQIIGNFTGFQQLYAIFNNGFVYSFIDGCDIALEKLWDIKYGRLIAEKMAQLHCLPTDKFMEAQQDTLSERNKPESQLFPTILKWIDRLADEFIDSSRKIKK